MRTAFTVVILFLQFHSPAFGGSIMNDYLVTKHAGYLHWKKARELSHQKKWKEALEEEANAIFAYAHEKKEAIHVQALSESLDGLSHGCRGANMIPNCEKAILAGIATLRKFWKNMPGRVVEQYERNVGDYYFAKGDYRNALNFYQAAYPSYAQQDCSSGHAWIILKLLNAHLRLKEKALFDNYWNMANRCISTGKMEKNTEFFHDAKKNEVYLKHVKTQGPPLKRVASSKQASRKVIFTDSSALYSAIVEEHRRLLSELDQAKQQVRDEMKKNASPEELRALEKMWADGEKVRFEDSEDLKVIAARDPAFMGRVQKLQLKNIESIQLGASKQTVFGIFGNPERENPQEGNVEYVLMIGGPIGPMGSAGGPALAPIYFKFDTQDRLVEIGHEKVMSGERWVVRKP